MSDSFELIGDWWLPEKPERKIHGKLSYDRKMKSVLSLDSDFGESEKEVLEKDFHEVILGDSIGKKVTLTNCFRIRLSITHTEDSKEYKQSEYGVSIFYVGKHFSKKEDVKFTKLFVEYSQLEKWLGDRLFDSDVTENEGIVEYKLKFTKPKRREIALTKFKICIDYGFSWTYSEAKPKFDTYPFVSLDFDDEMHIDELHLIAYHLRNFLSLGVGDRVSIIAMSGENKKTAEHERVEIFDHVGKESFDEKDLEEIWLPFNFDSISKKPEFYLENWFNLIENLEPLYDLFFGTLYNPQLYPTHEFLSFAQALESYHSRTFDNSIMPKEQFSELLKQMQGIIEKIPEEYQKQLMPKAQYDMNRKSLRRKIGELFEKYDRLFSVFVEKKDEFIDMVVNTRNYYTHYPPELKDKAANIVDMPFLSQNLRFMLIVILLKEIGFDDETTKQILNKYLRWRIVRIFA